jgi:hypothetical protein
MKNYINDTLKPRTAYQPKKGGPSPTMTTARGLYSQEKMARCT